MTATAHVRTNLVARVPSLRAPVAGRRAADVSCVGDGQGSGANGTADGTIGSMARFGIEDYQPCWLRGVNEILTAHGPRLAALTGQRLRHVWVVWDLDEDEWFTDAPVLLDFGTEQVELDHQRFDELSLTWNTMDPTREITDPWFHLQWRAEALPELATLPGQVLRDVELLEWCGGDVADGSVAVGFTFDVAQLTVYNTLDENGFEYQSPGPEYRRHSLRA